MRQSDFHNHWDGVLPVNALIRLYKEKCNGSDIAAEMELMGQEPNPLKKKNYENIVGLFARLTLRIHEKYVYKEFPKRFGGKAMADYRKVKGEISDYTGRGVPSRGAHMYQHMMIYLTAANYLIGGTLNEVNTIYKKASYEIFDNGEMRKGRYSAAIKYTEILLHNLYQKLTSGSALKTPGLKAICKRGINKYLKATKISPFDDAFVARSAFKMMWKGNKRTEIVGMWNQKTAEYLSDNSRGNLKYVEMSQPTDKIPWGGKYPKTYAYKLKWLALVATHREPMAGSELFPKHVAKEHIEAAVAAVGKGDIIGIDLAGCEGFEYIQKPSNELIGACLDNLDDRAENLSFKPVLRIHVGEGAGTSNEWWSYIERAPRGYVRTIPKYVLKRIRGQNRKNIGHKLARSVMEGLSRRGAPEIWRIKAKNFGVTAKNANDEERETTKEIAERAKSNVEVILKAIIAHYKTPERVMNANVKIRFGHVTHMDEACALLMKEYGIAGDFCLSSNLRTGVLGVLDKSADADELKKSGGRWNDIIKNLSKIIGKEHGLIHMIKVKGLYVLGTDGQGVEATDLDSEYKGYYALYEELYKKHNDVKGGGYVELGKNIEQILKSYKKQAAVEKTEETSIVDINLYELAKAL